MADAEIAERVSQYRAIEEVRHWLEFTCRLMVDDPKMVVVEWEEQVNCTVFNVTAGHQDGCLVGREGRLAESLRAIAKSIGRKNGLRCYVEVAPNGYNDRRH